MENVLINKLKHLISCCKLGVLGIGVLVSFFTTSHAQSAVIAVGGDGTGSGGSVAYSIGQVAYTNFHAEDGSISLGVQQPNLFLNVGTTEAEITLSATLFPNPSNTSTTLKIDGQDENVIIEDLIFRLYDLHGKLLMEQDIESDITTIPVDHLAGSVFILQVIRNDIEVKTFKIFKTN